MKNPTLSGFAVRNRGLAVLWFLVVVLAVVQTARLALFIAIPTEPQHSVLPWDTFWRTHSCFSAYIQAADRVRHGDPKVYELPEAVLAKYSSAYTPFEVDEYLYPPTFLPLPLLATAITGDFFTLRRAWFVIEVVLCLAGLLLVARWIGGETGRRLALWSPVLWATIPLLLTLQIGNFQLAAFMLGVMALIAVESGYAVAGGFTLAFLALGKVFPAILLLVLMARRRWPAVTWACVGGAMLVAITAVLVPWPTAESFLLSMLPNLSHGDQFLEGIDPVNRLRLAAVNFSVFGPNCPEKQDL